MRAISKIIIHCAATPPEMDIGAKEIRDWHVKDNGWSDIGYHWVIRRDGQIEPGRPEATRGAHCAAKNGNVASIGICMVGGVKRVPDGKTASGKPKTKLVADDNFTQPQWVSLRKLVRDLHGRYPNINTVLGHRDLDPGKVCPSFSVRDWQIRERIREITWA